MRFSTRIPCSSLELKSLKKQRKTALKDTMDGTLGGRSEEKTQG